MVELKLPWPPSTNHYLRRYHLSNDAKAYRDIVSLICRNFCKEPFGDARLKIEITAHAKDYRKRDLDNLLKNILDALQNAGLFDNDEQIDDLRIIRGQISRGDPYVIVRIEQFVKP